MTQISLDEVRALAQLSSLQLADDEIDGLSTDISKLLSYIDQLNELNTEGVESTYQLNDPVTVWREDEVQSSISGSELVKMAADSYNNQIKVPKVL